MSKTRLFALALAICLCLSMFSGTVFADLVDPVEEEMPMVMLSDNPIYKDLSYSFEERAADLIAHMTLSEKASQMISGWSPAIPRLGVEWYGWWNEALHGVSRLQTAADANATTLYNTTSYPQSFGVASTWDPALMNKEASEIANEAREVVTGNDRMLTFYSPTVNLARDPRWGRNDESFGEDPYLAAAIGAQFVNGMEGKNMDGSLIDPNGYKKSVATIKHYAANNSEVNRLNGTSNMSQRDLREYYLDVYKRIIKASNVTSVMGSYNKINDMPTNLDPWLMDTILRQTYGFSGYVTSDCDSVWVAQASSRQNWTNPMTNTRITYEETVAWALNAAIDLQCNNGYRGADFKYSFLIPRAIAQKITTPTGVFDENSVDKSLLRLFTARMEMGEFDDKTPGAPVKWYNEARERVTTNYAPGWTYTNATGNGATTMTQARSDLAREVGQAAMVLLKNDNVSGTNNKLLPLQVPASGNFKVAVIGYLANPNSMYLGGYSVNMGTSAASKLVNPYNGLKQEIQAINPNAEVTYYKGFTGTGTTAATLTAVDPAAITAAAAADVCIVFTGTDNGSAREDVDRSTLALPGAQAQLIQQVAQANPKTIAVMETNAPNEVSVFESATPAILWSCYNGQVKGLVLADVILGKYNPSGRTSTIWYKSTSDIANIRSYKMTPGIDTYYNNTATNGRTYMYYNGTPQYPFGYGLSYTTFDYSNLQVTGLGAGDTADANGKLTVKVDVKNSGSRDGNEIVEMYVATPDAASELQRPFKRLKGFQKVMVPAGQTKTVTMELDVADLVFFNEATNKYEMDMGKYEIQVSKSSADSDIKLRKVFTTTGTYTPKLDIISAKPVQEGDRAKDIPERVFFNKGMTIDPQLTVSLTDESIYGYISKGNSKPLPEGASVTYTSNRPSVVSVDGSGTIKTVGEGVATVTATVRYLGETQKGDFIVYVLPDVTLSSIKVGGQDLVGFDPLVTNYTVALAESVTEAPEVTATTYGGTGIVTVQQATTVPGTAIITVTEGINSKTYYVGFSRGPQSDLFAANQTAQKFTNIVGEDSANYSFSSAGLRINTQKADFNGGTDAPMKNLFLQPGGGSWVAQTHITFAPTPSVNNQQAGLTLYNDANNYVKLVYERPSTGTTNTVRLYQIVDGTSTQVASTNSANQTQMYLRLIKNGIYVTGQFSTNGNTWTDLTGGAAEAGYTTPQLGVFAINGNTAAASIGATFEYVKVGSIADLNPFLSSVQKGGVDIESFNSNTKTYNITVPRSDTVEDVEMSATPGMPNWKVDVTQITALPGTATIKVSSELATATYTFSIKRQTFAYQIQIDSVTFDPTTMAEAVAQKQVVAEVSATSVTDDPTNCMVIVALYKEDVLQRYASVAQNLASDASVKFVAGFDVPAEAVANPEKYTVKVFCWDGLSLKNTTMKPLSNITILE